MKQKVGKWSGDESTDPDERDSDNTNLPRNSSKCSGLYQGSELASQNREHSEYGFHGEWCTRSLLCVSQHGITTLSLARTRSSWRRNQFGSILHSWSSPPRERQFRGQERSLGDSFEIRSART